MARVSTSRFVKAARRKITLKRLDKKIKLLTDRRTKLMHKRDRLTEKVRTSKSWRVKRNNRQTRKHVRDEITGLTRQIRELERQKKDKDLADAGTALVRAFNKKAQLARISTYQVHYLLESDEIDRDNPILYNSSMSQSAPTRQYGGRVRHRRYHQTPATTYGSSGYSTYGSSGYSAAGQTARYPTIKRTPSRVSPYAHPLTSKNKEWERIRQELETQMKTLFKENTVLHIPNPLYPNDRSKQLIFTIRSRDWRPFPFKGKYQKYASFFKKSPFKFIIVPSNTGEMQNMIVVTTVHLQGRLQTASEKSAEIAKRIALKKAGKTPAQIDRIMGTSRRKSTPITRLEKRMKCEYHLEELREIMRQSGLFPKPHLTKYQQMVERQKDETRIRNRSDKSGIPGVSRRPSAPPLARPSTAPLPSAPNPWGRSQMQNIPMALPAQQYRFPTAVPVQSNYPVAIPAKSTSSAGFFGGGKRRKRTRRQKKRRRRRKRTRRLR